ncbi:MAG: signal peptidase I [Clostridia bacterium]|nr:signal peptidase I [Clostridia bacterium]
MQFKEDYYDNLKEKQDKQKKLKLILSVILVLLIIVFCVFTFICSPVIIQGDSMTPTLKDGEIIFISKIHKTPLVGDIIVYKKPDEPKMNVIKRVVGVAGDTFEFDSSLEHPTNGIILKKVNSDFTCLLNDDQYINLKSKFPAGKFTLGEDEVFTLGDNSTYSIDARNYGPVNLKNLIGIKLN